MSILNGYLQKTSKIFEPIQSIGSPAIVKHTLDRFFETDETQSSQKMKMLFLPYSAGVYIAFVLQNSDAIQKLIVQGEG